MVNEGQCFLLEEFLFVNKEHHHFADSNQVMEFSTGPQHIIYLRMKEHTATCKTVSPKTKNNPYYKLIKALDLNSH